MVDSRGAICYLGPLCGLEYRGETLESVRDKEI